MSSPCSQAHKSNLFREFVVTIPHKDLQAAIEKVLAQKAAAVTIPGYRPGKAPLARVFKKYEDQVVSSALDNLVEETSEKLMRENKIRPALQPHFHMGDYQEGKDFSYSFHMEVMPEIEPVDPSLLSFKLYKVIHDPSKDRDFMELQALLHSSVKNAGRPAQVGDLLSIDYEGKISGEATSFEKKEGFQWRLGSGQGIVTLLEKDLVSRSEGDSFVLSAALGDAFSRKGKDQENAEFSITVKKVLEVVPHPIDNTLAEKIGCRSLEELQELSKAHKLQVNRSLERSLAKQIILDALDAQYSFEVPQGLVDLEFKIIKQQYDQEMNDVEEGLSEKRSPESLAEEFLPIAERRVRLGLILADIGSRHQLGVSSQELVEAVISEARHHGVGERQAMEYYQKNTNALTQLRAKVLEEKTIDFILKTANIQEEAISEQELVDIRNKKLDDLQRPATGA